MASDAPAAPTTPAPGSDPAAATSAARGSPWRVLDVRRWSLGARLGATLVLAALVPMAIISVAATRAGQNAVEASELEAAQGAARVGAAAVDEYLAGVAARADQIGTSAEVVGFLTGSGPAPDLGAGGADVIATVVADTAGTIVAGPADRIGTSVAADPWFVDAVAGKPSIGTLDSTEYDRPSITVAAPARRPGAAVVGVAALEVSGDDVLFALNQIPLGPGGQALLVDDDDRVVAARDSRVRGRTLDELGMGALAAGIAADPSGSLPRVPLAGRGEQVVAWSDGGGDAVAVVTQPRQAFLAPIDQLATTTRVALVITGLVALVLALLVARRLSRPVGALTRAARAIEEGTAPDDSELATIGRAHDDVGRLARVFARMAEQVAVRERALKEQVRALRVEIDHERRKKDVDEVVGSDFFRDLEGRAAEMRRRAKGEP